VVAAADVFMTGEWHVDGQKPTAVPMLPQPHHKDVPFLGFWLGYNRSLPGQRAHDLLTLIGHLRDQKDIKEVCLVGVGRAGPWALLAKALAGEAVAKTAVNVQQFDFDQVRSVDDPMLLPGALKYGGMEAIYRASETGMVWVSGAKWNETRVEMRYGEPACPTVPQRSLFRRGRSAYADSTALMLKQKYETRSASDKEMVEWLLAR
jgi:hypothetical protein